ncbi:tripartite tricarboxylate transporter TctB family protein [Paenibacillus thermotolerans]|uniref:tripartite tricarboxylate transporter TctB family protein n=1 Tax=Paenibacillus thermotolerans TaxID=3027807 RepID=UPI00236744E1|nr:MULTISPECIES: tripartite tricarboxylate transporter TctB family protein [unclassified Paenibacillus]
MNKTFDKYASIALFIVGAAFVLESRGIASSAYGSNVGPNIFPLGLGIILLLLCAKLFYETFRYPDKEAEKQLFDYKRFFIIFGAAILYALLLETLGYIVTTFLFLVTSFQVMQRGGLLKSIVIAGAFSFGVYYIFVTVLQGSLPGLPVWFQ